LPERFQGRFQRPPALFFFLPGGGFQVPFQPANLHESGGKFAARHQRGRPGRGTGPGSAAVTRRGRRASGLWAGETAEAIFLRTGASADTRIPRKEIEALTLSNVSLMPEGFDKVLSRQELSDLVEFLLGRR
jgi:hypothetical protein